MQLVAADHPPLRSRCREAAAGLFVTYWGEVFVNPRISQVDKPVYVAEGCLSLPVSRQVRRWLKIKLADGRTYEDMQAIVIQHERAARD